MISRAQRLTTDRIACGVLGETDRSRRLRDSSLTLLAICSLFQSTLGDLTTKAVLEIGKAVKRRKKTPPLIEITILRGVQTNLPHHYFIIVDIIIDDDSLSVVFGRQE